MNHPPGPLNINAYLGLTWRHWWWYATEPLEFVTHLGRTYGDICFYRVFNKRIYMLNRPEWIRKVLVEETDRIVKLPKDALLLSKVFGQGLIASDGSHWRQQRRCMQRCFTPEHVSRQAADSESVFAKRIAQWAPGPRFAVEEACQELFVEATAASLFGVALSQDEIQSAARSIRCLSRTLSGEMAALVQLPEWLPTSTKKAKRRALCDLRMTMQTIVRRASASGAAHNLLHDLQTSASTRRNRGSQETTILDEVTTMFVAGSHTTAAAMVWICYCLTTHPEVQSQAREEVLRVCRDDGPLTSRNLPYTESVIREVLRLYPPAWTLFFRMVVDDVQVGPYTLPKGAWVAIYPYVTHRDGRYFPDPLRFDPERFSPSRIHQIPKHAYFPYGLGPHTCMGATLANEQMLRLTAAILREFQLDATDDEAKQFDKTPDVVADLAIRPRHSLHLRLARLAYTGTPVGSGL